MSLQRTILILAVILGVSLGALFLMPNNRQISGSVANDSSCALGIRTLDLRGKISVEMAETPAQLARGLSGRAKLEPDAGMLFRTPRPGTQSFWMNEMLIPLDIIWLDPDLRVLSFVENARPESYPDLFHSPENVQYVLEVNAGFVAERGIIPGDIGVIADCAS